MNFLSQWANGEYGWTLVLVIALFFTGVTIIFYYTRDTYEPEPLSNILKAFLLGIFSVIPALIVSLIVIQVIPVNTILLSIVIAPIVEEIVKGSMVLYLARDNDFDGPLDGLVYGSMIGAGFAVIENLIYALGSDILFSIQLTLVRSIPQIISHPLYTGLFGSAVGAYKVGLKNNQYEGLRKPILLHAGWNASVSSGYIVTILGGLAVIIGLSIYYLRRELKYALFLDKQAYERGYYEEKRKYLEYQHEQEIRLRNQWHTMGRGPINQNIRPPNDENDDNNQF